MGTSNFYNMGDFPLYVITSDMATGLNREDYLTDEEYWDATDYCWQDYCDFTLPDIEAEINEFNYDLFWHEVSLKDGYYDGIQFYVADTDWTVEDVVRELCDTFLWDCQLTQAAYDYCWHYNNSERDICNILGIENMGDYNWDSDGYSEPQEEAVREIIERDVEANLNAEIEQIHSWLAQEANRWGFVELALVGTFSNGEAVYRQI